VDSRDVAQPGSVPVSGSGGRKFKSSHPDHLNQGLNGFPLGPFLVRVAYGVANEGQIGLNLPP
jgi:hypothetical protein